MSVRLSRSGRAGRYAVLYFGSMGDARKAVEETRHMTNSPNVMGAEASVLLAEEDLVDDKS